MDLILRNLSDIAQLGGWAFLWAVGGWWLVRRSFNLRPNEELLAGVGVGLVLENWFANLLARIMPIPAAFYVSAGVIFALGLLFSLPLTSKNWRDLFRPRISFWQLALFLALTYVLIVVGRGMAVLDDYQNLPTTSILATGSIPPVFPLDPKVQFNYHYSTLLFAAQLMRIADFYPWFALDVTRGLGFAISLMLTGLFVQRVTRSVLGGFIGGLMAAFGGGTRWLLLFLPEGLLTKMSQSVNMIGSGAATAPDLLTALTSKWAFEGGGPLPIPFAYVNGLNSAAIWTYHAGSGGIGGIIGAFIALSFNRWRGWRAAVVTSLLLSALALSSELAFAKLGAGLVIVALIYMIAKKSFRLPRSLWYWLGVFVPAGLLSAIQGGVITGVFTGFLASLGIGVKSAYFTAGFAPMWPPALLSSHLGFLSLANPYHLLLIFLEGGPIILVLPLVIAWGIKAFRYGRWVEVAPVVMMILSIPLAFVEYTGSAGPTALSNTQAAVMGLCSSWAVRTLWLWAGHRSEKIKTFAAALLFVSIFGGIMVFGMQMISAPKPVFSTFISILDVRAENDYWNQLEPSVLIFDPEPNRAVTLFGRPSDSHITWYESKPEWEELVKMPDPQKLREAGYQYAYLDSAYWHKMASEYRSMWEKSCVVLVEEYVWDRYPPDFRRLYDVSACQ